MVEKDWSKQGGKGALSLIISTADATLGQKVPEKHNIAFSTEMGTQTRIHTLSFICSIHRHMSAQTHAGGTEKCSVPICCAPGPLSGGPQSGIQPCQDWHSSHKHTHAHPHLHLQLYHGFRRCSITVFCVCLFMVVSFHFSPFSQITGDKCWGERVKDTVALLTEGENRAAFTSWN